MRICGTLLLLAFLSLAGGCSTGTHFSPGVSMTDKEYFMDPPYIAATPDGYNLRWRYGTMGASFLPASRIENGHLLFTLYGASGNDHLTGQYGELPITCEKCIHALQRGGVFWVEPDRREVRLEVRRVLTTPHP